MAHIRALRSRLEKQPTDLRQYTSYLGDRTLADANLLDGRRATTHWNWCNELARKHPLVKIDSEPIYIRDQNTYTSSGSLLELT
ncbi:MAG: hypothetical protein JO313_12250 [Verrucomicrobia bacterium]|nr:hypothetical protein [Verrucomicrobiota bacterium]MBV9645299.1 hypothetical protein [Verrucomicrobiota bacterium]